MSICIVFRKVKDDIKFDTCFDGDVRNMPLPPPAQSKPPSEHLGQDKRSQLLKRKLESTNSQQMNTFESRVDQEINRNTLILKLKKIIAFLIHVQRVATHRPVS